MDDLSDINIKIILADLGKNEALQRIIKNKFGQNYKLSVGIDILTKDITFANDLNVTLTIWDIKGEDIFEVVKDLYRKEEEMALIVFDLTKLTTCEQVNKNLEELHQINLDKYPYILLVKKPSFFKKDDLYVYSIDAKMFAQKVGCGYLEVSSQIDSDIDKVFNRLARKILNSKVSV